jgi:hypothetical protein
LLVFTNRQLRLEIDSLKTRLSASKTASFNAGVAAVAGSGISDLENSANLENSTGSFIGSSSNAATAARTDQVRTPTFHILVPKLLFYLGSALFSVFCEAAQRNFGSQKDQCSAGSRNQSFEGRSNDPDEPTS